MAKVPHLAVEKPPAGITVGESLQLPELKDIQMVAGHEGIHRIITDVSVLEIPADFQRWLRGNEFILSALYAHDDALRAQEFLVRELASAGVAAFGLHPGEHGLTVHPRAREVADGLGFPVLLLPQDMPYSRVFQAVLGEILNRQAASLRRSEEINRFLTRIVVSGGGLQDVVTGLVRLVGRPLALVTRRGMPLAADAPPGAPRRFLSQALECFSDNQSTVVQQMRRLATLPRMNGGPELFHASLTVVGRSVRQVICPVQVGTEIQAFVVIWEDGKTLEDWEQVALQHAATVLSFMTMRQRVEAETPQGLYAQLIEKLQSGGVDEEDAIGYRSAYLRLGLEPDSRHAFLVAEVDRWQQPSGAGAGNQPGLSEYLLARLRRILRELEVHQPLAAVKSGQGIVLASIPGDLDDRAVYRSLGQLAGAMIEALRRDELEITIGVGRVCRAFEELDQSLHEARSAVGIGSHLFGSGQVYFADDLWIYSTLARAHSTGYLDGSWKRLLDDLLEEDRKAEGHLLRTLDAFLDAQQSYVKAARRLYVHPNTVRYRIDKVKAIIGVRVFTDPILRLTYHLALKTARLLGEVGTTNGPGRIS